MARLRSITNSNLNLRRREDKADADDDADDNLRAQVTGDLPGHPSHHQQSINQSINHRHPAAACKRYVGCMSVFRHV